MFGISKREIANKIAQKIIDGLKSKGSISLPHVGTLVYTSGKREVRFIPEDSLLDELEEK